MNSENLVKQAFLAQKNSKSKYSHFPVGCALLSENNDITLGCNIESAAYPSTICAERVAIYAALSNGLTKFKAIAIVSRIKAKPCGQCRQIIHEYLGNIPIYISDGLIGDMNKLINNQNLSYEIYLDEIPVSIYLKTLLKNSNKKKENYLFHGDDYQILFTAHKKSRKSIKKFSKIINQKITIIGKINGNLKKSVLLTNNKRKILTNFEAYFHKF